MKTNFLLLWLLVLGLSAGAQQRYELTVKDAVDMAYKNVIELKNAQLDYQIQEAKNREILGQAYPQVTGNAGANHYLKLPVILFPQSEEGIYQVLKREGLIAQSVKAPPPTSAAFSIQQPWNLQVGVTVQQLLFQPDVFVGLQARKIALSLSNSAIDVAKEKIKDSAYKRYYAILIAEKQLHFLNEGMARLQKLYNDDSVMYKNGFAERLDLDKVQVQLNNLTSTRNTVANAVQIGYAALKLSLGLSQQDTVVLKEELNSDVVKQGVLDESFNYENRAVVRQLGYNKDLLELDVKRNKLGALPTVALAGNYTLNGQGQYFFTNSNTLYINSSYIGLNINVPIFDGLQRRYKIKEAELNVKKLENTITNVKQAIDFEQVINKATVRNSLSDLDIQERNLTLAEKVFNATKLKFQNGLGSSFEVLQSDSDLQQAQAAYFNALYNAIIAKVSYQNSLGKL